MFDALKNDRAKFLFVGTDQKPPPSMIRKACEYCFRVDLLCEP